MSARVARAKVTFDREWQEYRVKAWDAEGQRIKPADYFTDDREDAHDTAAAMVRR